MGKAIGHILYIKIYIYALTFSLLPFSTIVIILSSFIYILFSLFDFYMSSLFAIPCIFFFLLTDSNENTPSRLANEV